jgi:hypothetical protein
VARRLGSGGFFMAGFELLRDDVDQILNSALIAFSRPTETRFLF